MSEGAEKKSISGRGLPLHGNDIDTDRIIPARYLKCVTFEELGKYAFYDERFDAGGKPLEHPFNDKRYAGASVLLVNANFGCGSSREHAPQSLMRMGIKAIVGESFAEIFAGNCTALGIPAVLAEREIVERLMAEAEARPSTEFTVDLQSLRVSFGGNSFKLSMAESTRQSLLTGTWDSTSTLLRNINAIRETASELPYISGY